MRQRNSKSLKQKNSKIPENLNQSNQDISESEKSSKVRCLNNEMVLLKKMVSRAKESKNGCTNCTKKAIRRLRQRIKDTRKELGMKLFGIPGREF